MFVEIGTGKYLKIMLAVNIHGKIFHLKVFIKKEKKKRSKKEKSKTLDINRVK